MMILKTLLAALVLISINAAAQNYVPQDTGSKVHFIIKNFGINTGGDLTGLKGRIYFSPDSLNVSKFDVSVVVSTIDTDNNMRDKNLTESEYFDASKFPLIKLVSSKISKTNKTAEGFYFFSGNLTIKEVTKAISFPFQAKKINDSYLFTGDFEIDRSDFGVGEKNIVLSNKVAVSLSINSKKN